MKIVSSTKERGSAVVVVLMLISIMTICIAVNLASIRGIEQEVKMLDRNQSRRLHPELLHSRTNDSGSILQSR